MTLPDQAVYQAGTALVFASSTFVAEAGDKHFLGARTDQIELSGVATATARQSDKVDLTASRSPSYAVTASIEWATPPVVGEVVSFYWAPSESATAGQDNPGNIVGVDSAYAGTADDSVANSVRQLQFIGVMPALLDDVGFCQTSYIGKFSPPAQYGTLVVYNETSDNFDDSSEMSVRLSPIVMKVID